MSLRLFGSLIAALTLAISAGCRPDGTPDPGSEEYREAVTAFYTGVAALQVGQDRHAEEQLLRVTALAPDEPAAWANLGVLAMRRSELDLADERLDQARELAPENSRIHYLSGLVASTRGDVDAAISHFEEAVERDPANIRATYALAEQVEQRGGEAERVRQLIQQILETDPDHLAALVERARLAALDGDVETVRQMVERLEAQSTGWSEETREQLSAVRQAVQSGDMQDAGTQISFLNNVLKREADYRESLASVQTQPGEPHDLITSLLALSPPDPRPAPPDDSLSFGVEPLFTDLDARTWSWARAVALSSEGLPVVVAAGGDEIVFEDGTSMALPGAADLQADGMIALDYNYDFRVDLAFAGPRGLRVFRQEEDSSFTDVSSELAISQDVRGSRYSGGWSVDLDLEGDLDLILARPDGPPVVLRNRGDDTFQQVQLFGQTTSAVDFSWSDLDADGDPDAVFVDAGGAVHIYENRRSQGFRHRHLDEGGDAAAITTTDLDHDGVFELIVLRRSGAVDRIQQAVAASDEERSQPAVWDDMRTADRPRIFAADVDNNGAIDLVASAGGRTAVWLRQPDGSFGRLRARADADTYSLSDITGGGRLDLIGLADGAPVRLGNRGMKSYHSKTIRPLAATAVGDQRINPFGLGGEIEVRSGILFQKQPITDPVVHFGLGDQLVVDVARIVWPNGDIQAEFDLLSDETVQARQRLKGSCPWLFTFDGEQMQFVTDFIWRSPLGLRINAQETAGVMMTEDWVKIDGSELRPRDGYYDVRITAELWETHFFDHVSMMVVDHPEDTEIWVDERFAFPPPELKVHATGPPRPVREVRDDEGRDVTEYVLENDERYLDTFDRGPYQGIAESHSIVVDLEDAPASGPLYLLASGWVRPTDSSINVAVSQGMHDPPTGLRLDVPDGDGWKTVYPNLGFPAGKHKTILVDLTDVFEEASERRVRLTTNLEIYWDALHWAEGRSDADLRMARLDPTEADLRYRGYSAVSAPERSRPEVPTYDSLMATSQIWRDLIGYYTRFGDVRELLGSVDDRYVIMNAGDELAFQFAEMEPPADGWVRDFVLIGDGWVKDGDYNTTYSETVRPLPAHDLPEYMMPRGALEDDEVYRRHPDDWREYHTRFVTPDGMRTAMTR